MKAIWLGMQLLLFETVVAMVIVCNCSSGGIDS